MAVMIGIDPHSGKEAIRALKRRISDAVYARPHDAALQATRQVAAGPGGHTGNDSVASAAGSHPEHRLFGQATPGPDTTLRPTGNRPRRPGPKASSHSARKPLDNHRGLDRARSRPAAPEPDKVGALSLLGSSSGTPPRARLGQDRARTEQESRSDALGAAVASASRRRPS
jgi:hypothetical protein